MSAAPEIAGGLPSVRMQEPTWEVAGYLGRERIAVVPVGGTEQHGPAGVLGADAYVAITLAEDLAQRTGAGVDFQEVFGRFVGDDLSGPAPDGVDIIWSGEEQRRFAPTGSFSSSLDLSEEKGRRYHDHIVARLGELVEGLRSDEGPVGAGSPGRPRSA